jgi:hypothetical protein
VDRREREAASGEREAASGRGGTGAWGRGRPRRARWPRPASGEREAASGRGGRGRRRGRGKPRRGRGRPRGAVAGRDGGVGEREAASGPILGGLQLEFGSSPKMRAQIGPLEFSNS